MDQIEFQDFFWTYCVKNQLDFSGNKDFSQFNKQKVTQCMQTLTQVQNILMPQIIEYVEKNTVWEIAPIKENTEEESE